MLLNPSDLMASKSRRQGSRSPAGLLDTIGAREVPPPYHTPIGTNGEDGCGALTFEANTAATRSADNTTRIAPLCKGQGKREKGKGQWLRRSRIPASTAPAAM